MSDEVTGVQVGCTCGQTSHTVGCPWYRPLGGQPSIMFPTIIPVGWTCPACGGGNAPLATRCPCVPLPPPFGAGFPVTHIGDPLLPPSPQVLCETGTTR